LRFADPTGTDAVMVEYPLFKDHYVVWVGPDAAGIYRGFSLEPTGAGGYWSAITGRSVRGYVQEEKPTRFVPGQDTSPILRLFAKEIERRSQGPEADARLIARFK